MKPGCFFLCLALPCAALGAEPKDSCAGLDGAVLTQCRNTELTLRQQERLEQLLQQQQERQNEFDKQQRDVQQQLESMRLQNEALRKQLELEAANQPARPVATASAVVAKNEDLKSWKAANPWFGSDYAKTQFAMHYAKELQKDRPELTGRPLLDALSAKVSETFGDKH